MATTSTSTAIAAEPVFTEYERLALAGFLAGYTGLTREAYALDLRQFASWCQQHHVFLYRRPLVGEDADVAMPAGERDRLGHRGRTQGRPRRRLLTRVLTGRTPRSGGPAWSNEFCVPQTEFPELLAQREPWND